MGAVYRATDQKFGTAVAIKETFYRDKELAEAFEREARLLNGLHHPLFPHVSDHFSEGEGHFLVMEYIEGEDLSVILKRGERFPFETVMRWSIDLLDGLDHLHSQDPPIIHRDIKPSNLKLTSRGNVVLLDFGMAKETSGNTQGMRSVFGYSRRYSPLEQIEGTGTDVRSDIFSLGATVYHLLTGTPPVDVLRRASAIVAGRPDPIESASSVNPDVPERIAAIINSALALNPEKRFVSVRAMWSALEHSLNGGQSLPAASAVAPIFAPPVLSNTADDTPVENFPALEAFEAETDAEAAMATPGSVFKMEAEDDPIAALVAQRVAQMKEADGAFAMEAPNEPVRIEVPVISKMEHDHVDVSEKWGADVPEPEEEIVVPVLVAGPGFSASRHNYPALIGIPLLLLFIGFVAYALLRSSPTSDERVQESPPQEIVTTPESPPVAPVSPGIAEETTSDADTSVTTEESNPEEPANSERTEVAGSRSSIRRQPKSSNAERSFAEKPASQADRRSELSRSQARGQVAPKNQASRTGRPRIANDEVFEQPPVSSIESIMTGIPKNQTRRQRRWEVLEEDQLRRERRIRRINRRNRQRQYPLF